MKISVITQSCRQREYTVNCIKSLYHFCPDDITLNTIVIENSNDVSYKHEVESISTNITWINDSNKYGKSMANAQCIMNGLKLVQDEWVLLLHNDTCVTSPSFFTESLNKISGGYGLIGTCYDRHPNRHSSIIVLGCFVKTEIAKKIDFRPGGLSETGQEWDTGEKLHIYCRENNIKTFCFDNTYNNPEIIDRLFPPFKDIIELRTIDKNNEVMFMHFCRGTEKSTGSFSKRGRFSMKEAVEFCNKHVFTKRQINDWE